jgi:hypothetical protein
MSVQAKIKMIVGRKVGMATTPAYNYPEKSSTSALQGAPVKVSSGVLVAPSTTNAGSGSVLTYVNKSSTSSVVGILGGKARSGYTSDLVVYPLREGLEFEGNLVHATASSAAVSKVGSTVYLGQDKSSDSHWGWSLTAPGANSGSYIQGQITALIDDASTVNGRVVVAITKGGALSAF